MRQQKIIQDPYSNIDMLMWHVTKLLVKNKKQILDGFGLTCSQFEMLAAIYSLSSNKEEIIQINLSEKTRIDPMTTSTTLRNLQKKGLITRTRSTVNTRTVIVELTHKGQNLYIDALTEINMTSDTIYQNIDKQSLASQLLILSDKLNKLNC